MKGMYAYCPHEAKKEALYWRQVMSLLVAAIFFILLVLAKNGAVSYVWIQLAKEETQGFIGYVHPHPYHPYGYYVFVDTEQNIQRGVFAKGWQEEYPLGQELAVSYSRWRPELNVRTADLPGLALELYMAMGAMLAMLGSLWISFRVFRELLPFNNRYRRAQASYQLKTIV